MDAYTGLPGSGKSYGVVEYVIVPAVEKGRDVWTNIPLVPDQWLARYGVVPNQFTTQDIIDNPRWFLDVLPKGALLVLDECQMVWPSGLKANKIHPAHAEFLTQHRHRVGGGFTTQIVLVTQDLQNIASYVRSLVKFTYRATDLSSIGQDKRFRVDVLTGAITGPKQPKNALLRQYFGKYRADVYSLYLSHTASDEGAGDETRVDTRANALGSMKFKLIPLAWLFCVLFLWWAGQRVYGSYAGDQDKPVHSDNASSVRPAVPRPLPPKVDDVFKPYDLTIALNMGRGGSTRYVITASNTDSYFQLTPNEFRKLGYTVSVVNECLLVLRNNEIQGYKRFITCGQTKKEKFLDVNMSSVTGSM